MTTEMRDTIYDLMEATEWDITKDEDEEDSFCFHCPYRERCDHEELYWGCPVWEEQMGEDL